MGTQSEFYFLFVKLSALQHKAKTLIMLASVFYFSSLDQCLCAQIQITVALQYIVRVSREQVVHHITNAAAQFIHHRNPLCNLLFLIEEPGFVCILV